MKNIIFIQLGILLSASLMSCSQISSNSSACNSAGYYGDQSECQNSVSSGVCASTTVSTTEKNLVCWKSSTTSNQTGTTTGGTTAGCTSSNAAPWTMGAWTPTSCSTGVTKRTRTVTCSYSCGCSTTVPSTEETCTPNMFNGKHYETECTAAGGTPETVEGNRICRMNGASCKSGWTPLFYNGSAYTITSAASAQEHTNCTGGRSNVFTSYHNTFSPFIAVESRTYCSARNCFGCKSYSTVYATVNHIACY